MLIMMTGQDDSHLRDSVAVSEDDAEEETDVTPVGEQTYTEEVCNCKGSSEETKIMSRFIKDSLSLVICYLHNRTYPFYVILANLKE